MEKQYQIVRIISPIPLFTAAVPSNFKCPFPILISEIFTVTFLFEKILTTKCIVTFETNPLLAGFYN